MGRVEKENRDKSIWRLSCYDVSDLVEIRVSVFTVFKEYSEDVWGKRVGENLKL